MGRWNTSWARAHWRVQESVSTQILRLVAGLVAVCLAGVVPAQAAVSVAILDHQDQWTSTKGLGQMLGDLGQTYTDLTASVAGGAAINLTGYDTFIVGSFCTENSALKSALANAATTMRSFVNNGGTIIVLTHADQTVANEAWVQAPVVVTRADPDFGNVYRVQTDHQIFNSPNAISDANIQGWQYVGVSNTWPTSWESLSVYANCGVLAGDASPTLATYATIVEAGWGTGRAIFTSMALDKARNIGNTTAKAQAPRLMANLLQYAQTVKDGTAPAVIPYQNSDWTGPLNGRVFNDVNGNGVFDAGDTGIQGVGVSDAIDIVLTAADGKYTLPNSGGSTKLVYISLPSGYAKNTRWFQRLTASSAPADFNFPLTVADESQPFEFGQITDVHVGGNGNKPLLTAALGEIAAMNNPPAFIMATGDLTNAATAGEFSDYASAVNASAVKVFNVMGNHDGGSSSVTYRNYLGPDYYSFSYGDCHFLIVNSMTSTAQENNWIAQDLAKLRGAKRLFLFQHYAPSAAEFANYNSYGAKAVFSGHWHSQHTVMDNSVASYNSPTFLFGGIDCSPAGFKLIHVEPDAITSRMKWLADGKRLQIVMPSSALIIPMEGLHILVNAYETSAEVASMTYQVKAAGEVVAEGALARDSDWSWRATAPAGSVPRGAYDIEVQATNNRGEVSTASTSFMVLGVRGSKATPQQDWPQFGGGPQRGGFTATAIEPPLGPVWTHQTGGTFDVGSPVVKDQTVYLGLKDRTDFAKNGVLALHASDGSEEWFAPTPAAVSHSVAVDDTRVYANSHGGILHAFKRSDGTPEWNATLGSSSLRWQYGSPVLVGNDLYAGTFAYFARFNATTGAESWHQTYGSDWISCNGSPAVSGNVVVATANWDSNSLRGLNIATGASLWAIAGPGVHGSPVISDDRVVFTDYNGKINCANLNTGAAIWSKDLGGGRSASTPAVAFGIVVAGGTGSVKAFQLSDGQQLWNFPLATSALKMAPYNNTFAALAGSATIAGHTAYIPCGDGRLYALTLETGVLRWSMDFGAPLLSAPCIVGQVMYVTAYDGNVYALASQSTFTTVSMDFDADGDVDLEDFGHMQVCLSPAGVLGVPEGCEGANLNGDSVVDQADMLLFIDCFSGPDLPAPANCGGA